MIIRRCREEEIDNLVNLWYEVSIIAHGFINKDYWNLQKEEMKEKYLPIADNYVIEEDKSIVGFISMVQDYLAAIFIDITLQSKGYGKILLNYIKEGRNHIDVKVYKKNKVACDFYLKNGFSIQSETVEPSTGEIEYTMTWKSDVV